MLPQNPSSITFCLPSVLILWLNAWKTKQQGQTSLFSSTMVCLSWFPEPNGMSGSATQIYMDVCVCVLWMYRFYKYTYFCPKERNISTYKYNKYMSSGQKQRFLDYIFISLLNACLHIIPFRGPISEKLLWLADSWSIQQLVTEYDDVPCCG